jgi:hypothetical protein
MRNALADMSAFTRRFQQYKELATIGKRAEAQIAGLLKKKAA